MYKRQVCALIPRDWIVGRTADELVSDEGLPPDLVAERAELFRVRGI